MLGVITITEGIAAAKEAGLDLVEISPNAEPPVCKILDYSKYKYELQRKASAARKKQKTTGMKLQDGSMMSLCKNLVISFGVIILAVLLQR